MACYLRYSEDVFPLSSAVTPETVSLRRNLQRNAKNHTVQPSSRSGSVYSTLQYSNRLIARVLLLTHIE
jgi:hypothetical protein